MLRLSPRRVRAMARSGLVDPRRDERGHFRFSFQDLIVLRTARDLLESGIPYRRVQAALDNLREQLPQGRPLTSLRVIAKGDRVLVRDGKATWEAESSQSRLDFRIVELANEVAPLARDAGRSREGDLHANDWFEIGCDLEMSSPDEARDAYRRALEIDPDHPDAHVNLGRLLHEIGEVAAAERHYRLALARKPNDVTAIFNLGVAVEDLGRLKEAVLAYKEALLAEPDHADAHFNLSGVLERTGKKSAAVRHLKIYRELIDKRGWKKR